MKASLFCSTRYSGSAGAGWPVGTTGYSADVAHRSMQRMLNQAKLGDEVGFDSITVAEHHYAPFSMTPNPSVLAAALTQVLKNAKIALLGPDLPILNPIRVAEEIAMLDTIFNGGVIVGLMRGTANEYVSYNINPSESRARFQEAVELVRMAWTEPEPFGWLGRHYEYRTVSIWPRPVQKPHPPIFISAASPESAEFAAENRLGAGFAFTTIDIAKDAAALYRKKAQAAGWEVEPENVLYRLSFHVAETDDEAIDELMESAKTQPTIRISRKLESVVADSGYYGRDIETQRARLQSRGGVYDRIKNGQLLAGSPKTVLDQISYIKDSLNPGMLDLTLAAPHNAELSTRAIELFGKEVLPHIRNL